MAESYFLGGISASGFTTDFDKEISSDGRYTFILKGGAGTGKSSLMKRLYSQISKSADAVKYYCSSDPDSLDAVVCKTTNTAIVDGTSPHTFDPVYPGAFQEVINLGEFWDSDMLKRNAIKIKAVTDSHKQLMNRAKRYIVAASSLCYDTYKLVSDCILESKLDAYVSRLTSKLLPKRSGNGSVKFAQLSAVTPHGYKTMTDTINDYKNIFVVNDDYYFGSDKLLKLISAVAEERGYTVLVGKYLVINELVYEHILIPEISTAFVTSNPMNKLYFEKAVKINMLRFYSHESLSEKKLRLKLNKNACTELVDETVQTLAEAKSIHDELEKLYIPAMDFKRIESVAERIIEKMKA